MDEELNKILSDESLDNDARKEAIKAYVGTGFVPMSKHSEQSQKFSALKTEFEEYKKTKMTDEEKREEEVRIAKEKEQTTNRMLSQMFAENVFSKAGFKEEDYKDIIPNILQSDFEATKKVAESIRDSMLAQKKAIEESVMKKIADGQKKPDGGNGDQTGNTETNLVKYQKGLEEAQKANDYTKVAYYTRLIQEEKFKNKK